jgi:hypothetical protein
MTKHMTTVTVFDPTLQGLVLTPAPTTAAPAASPGGPNDPLDATEERS